MSSDRNRVTVRKALRAGGLTGGIVVIAGVLATVLTGIPGGAVVLTAAIALGALVAAGWLLLAALLDVIAGEPPDVRRTIWTIATTLVAMLGPFLVLGALSQAATVVPAS